MYTDPMARIRRLVGPAAAIWLVIQTATLVLVPAFFISSQAAPIECTCIHDGNHGDCPMHRTSPMGARICIQATDSTGLATLSSMLGHVGLVPPTLETLHLTSPPLAVHRVAPSHPRTIAPPKPPPPRG